LMAVRGHLGDTPWPPRPAKGTCPDLPLSGLAAAQVNPQSPSVAWCRRPLVPGVGSCRCCHRCCHALSPRAIRPATPLALCHG
jgi:hypothetical protein